METSSDREKLEKLNALLNHFSMLNQRFKSIPEIATLCLHSSNSYRHSSIKTSRNSGNYIKEKLKKIFRDQYENYRDTKFTNYHEGIKLLHVTIVKQLWLDWGLISERYYRKLIYPIKQYNWVDFRGFYESIIHMIETKNSSFLKILKSKEKTKLERRKQKCLFFFSIFANKSKRLRKDKLFDLFELANNSVSKEQVFSLVNGICDIYTTNSLHLSIDDFKQAIGVNNTNPIT